MKSKYCYKVKFGPPPDQEPCVNGLKAGNKTLHVSWKVNGDPLYSCFPNQSTYDN